MGKNLNISIAFTESHEENLSKVIPLILGHRQTERHDLNIRRDFLVVKTAYEIVILLKRIKKFFSVVLSVRYELST
jgi:hypothetical protein